MSHSEHALAENSRSLQIQDALRAVEELRKEAIAIETEFAETLQRIPPETRDSALNFLHYLAVRRRDVSELQDQLSRLGLSSLGRMEAHVMDSLSAVSLVLHELSNTPVSNELHDQRISFERGDALLAEHATAIFGPVREELKTRIMVTMPSEAAEDPELICELLAHGMNIMRVNCAHDGPDAWARMIQHLRYAEKHVGLTCKVSCDLGGPKLRTGKIALGPEVIKWRPYRNTLGQVTAHAIVHFAKPGLEGELQGTAIPVGGQLVTEAQVGDIVKLVDTRGRDRDLRVVEVTETGCLCTCDRTGYVVTGTKLRLHRRGVDVAQDTVGNLEPTRRAIALSPGETLIIVKGEIQGREGVLNDLDELVEPAFVGCTLPEIFRDVKPGERIFLDDGKIGGVIREISPDQFAVEITSAAGGTAKLRSEKGINLPDTDLKLPALTEKDKKDLKFIAKNADMVALSFVQRPEDVEELISELQRLNAEHLGVVLKIETERAFANLPRLLLTALQTPPAAVMVARGDLGVEVGFERLSEVQEEVLWLCEAAHVPVIWATQVLESLAKSGLPSRAEVTDAAMGSRAECVMLNKGPYIRWALEFLCDVLPRMEAHLVKKTATLRRLSVSEIGDSNKG